MILKLLIAPAQHVRILLRRSRSSYELTLLLKERNSYGLGCFRCALQRLSGKARQSYGFSLECTSFLDENQQVTFFFSHFARCIRHNTGKETSDEMRKCDGKGDGHLYARATCCKASMLHTKNDKTKLKLGKLKRSWRGRKKDQIGR